MKIQEIKRFDVMDVELLAAIKGGTSCNWKDAAKATVGGGIGGAFGGGPVGAAGGYFSYSAVCWW